MSPTSEADSFKMSPSIPARFLPSPSSDMASSRSLISPNAPSPDMASSRSLITLTTPASESLLSSPSSSTESPTFGCSCSSILSISSFFLPEIGKPRSFRRAVNCGTVKPPSRTSSSSWLEEGLLLGCGPEECSAILRINSLFFPLTGKPLSLNKSFSWTTVNPENWSVAATSTPNLRPVRPRETRFATNTGKTGLLDDETRLHHSNAPATARLNIIPSHPASPTASRTNSCDGSYVCN
mmetsp:Transcript_27114/g.61796  ORF Transcript_27114/g.61796 Transcript_27114/m.61796 type:complete len:239 (+) Transcript_27114:916-1632(+)